MSASFSYVASREKRAKVRKHPDEKGSPSPSSSESSLPPDDKAHPGDDNTSSSIASVKLWSKLNVTPTFKASVFDANI